MADVTITVGEDSPATEEKPLPNGWRGRIAGLDIETGDERWLATPDGGVRTREYPLTLTFKHVGEDDIPIGNVLRVWSEDGMLYGEGNFDLENEEGRKYAGMLRDDIINTVSIHPDQVTAESRVVDPDGNMLPLDADVDSFTDEHEDGWRELKPGYRIITRFSDWRLAGLAMVSIPAYTEARIEPVFDFAPSAATEQDAIVAAGGVAHTYKATSFRVKAAAPTPLTMEEDEDGRVRVFGHLATWDACHMDFPGMCLTAPPAVDGFNRFHQHSARLDDGTMLAVGALTFGDGHSSAGSLYASRQQYANVATIAAKVVATEDEWGVFLCGEAVPSFDLNYADVVLHAPLSGHWEPDPDLDGDLALIAAHAVVTPGFNVRSLVAAYSPETDRNSLIITKQRARTNVRTEVDMDALVAAVEAKLHDRAAKKERLAAVQAKMAPSMAAWKAERVAELKARVG